LPLPQCRHGRAFFDSGVAFFDTLESSFGNVGLDSLFAAPISSSARMRFSRFAEAVVKGGWEREDS